MPVDHEDRVWIPADISIHWTEDELIGIDCYCGEYIVLSADPTAANDCDCGRKYKVSIAVDVKVLDK
jgi:hypothetical protein